MRGRVGLVQSQENRMRGGVGWGRLSRGAEDSPLEEHSVGWDAWCGGLSVTGRVGWVPVPGQENSMRGGIIWATGPDNSEGE